MIGGDGTNQNENLLALLGTPVNFDQWTRSGDVRRHAHVQLYAELSGGKSDIGGASQEPRDRGNLVIRRDNAFLPAPVRSLMIADNLQTITIGRVSDDTGKIKLDRIDESYEAVAGLTTHFGPWTAEPMRSSGRTSTTSNFGPNNRKQLEYLNAVDAVVDPATAISSAGPGRRAAFR